MGGNAVNRRSAQVSTPLAPTKKANQSTPVAKYGKDLCPQSPPEPQESGINSYFSLPTLQSLIQNGEPDATTTSAPTPETIAFHRLQSQTRLKAAWDSICEKYGREFDDADEIDLMTGEIVVDNGWVRNTEVCVFGEVFYRSEDLKEEDAEDEDEEEDEEEHALATESEAAHNEDVDDLIGLPQQPLSPSKPAQPLKRKRPLVEDVDELTELSIPSLAISEPSKPSSSSLNAQSDPLHTSGLSLTIPIAKQSRCATQAQSPEDDDAFENILPQRSFSRPRPLLCHFIPINAQIAQPPRQRSSTPDPVKRRHVSLKALDETVEYDLLTTPNKQLKTDMRQVRRRIKRERMDTIKLEDTVGLTASDTSITSPIPTIEDADELTASMLPVGSPAPMFKDKDESPALDESLGQRTTTVHNADALTGLDVSDISSLVASPLITLDVPSSPHGAADEWPCDPGQASEAKELELMQDSSGTATGGPVHASPDMLVKTSPGHICLSATPIITPLPSQACLSGTDFAAVEGGTANAGAASNRRADTRTDDAANEEDLKHTMPHSSNTPNEIEIDESLNHYELFLSYDRLDRVASTDDPPDSEAGANDNVRSWHDSSNTSQIHAVIT
ncbi:hypothetical protein BC832DRAFT_549905 [Gaertneriomyces semiglobifer]|nr:hypothetical protein BC832DRAFT_549905 [Gaertneriomyces semiglobifer]